MKTGLIALLRGINVGGNNKIPMSELKEGFEALGFTNVVTYINSGNILFDSETVDRSAIAAACHRLILEKFKLDIAACIITADELVDAITNAPGWWNVDKDEKHNAIFVIAPMTAEDVCNMVGEIKPEYEKAEFFGQVIFWSAPIKTFSHTRWSKIVENKAVYRHITIRNANTAIKLARLAQM